MKRFIVTLCLIGCCVWSCAPQQEPGAPLAQGGGDAFDVAQNATLQKIDTLLEELPPPAIYQVREPEVQIPPIPEFSEQPLPEDSQMEEVGLNFENADIHDVTKIVSEITGKSFIVDDDVQGTVTIYSEKSLSPDQVFELFKSVLELNGLAINQIGDFYKIVTSENAQKRYVTVDTDPYAAPEDSLVTQIVKLNYVKAIAVKNALQPLTSAEIIVYPDESGNTLIITDLASNVRKLLEVIREMDVSSYANQYVEIFPIQHADLYDLMDDLYQILAIPGAAGPMEQMVTQPEQQPAAEESAEPSVSPIVPAGTETTIYPIARLNALMVSTNNPDVLTLVRKWINILDQPSAKDVEEVDPTERANYVYPVRYSKAEELAPILVRIYEDTTQQQQEQQEEEAGVPSVLEEEQPPVFIEDTSSNSLIIRATPGQYAQILKLLEQLDIRPLQVLIDVIIAEVSLTDTDVFGVQGMLQGESQLTIGGETNVVNSTSTTGFPGIVGGDGFNYVINAPARFLAQLRALATESRVKVLSDPHILVQNNKEARINIGDSIPIRTVRGEGETAEETVEYRETGIILTVEPQINYEDDVVMHITQEVSSPGERESGATAPPINTTTAETYLVTQDGHPLVIGGLMSTREGKSKQGVPLLKDIPLLGRLFRYNEQQAERKELIILVIPRIVRTPEQGWNLTDDMLKKRVDQLEQLFNREATDPEKIKNFLKRQFSPEE